MKKHPEFMKAWYLYYMVLSVPERTANLYCIYLSIPKNLTYTYTKADAVQICGKFWDTQ